MNIAIYIALFFAIGAAPPLRWGLRIGALATLLVFFGLILTPTPYEPGWSHDLALASVFWTYITILAGIALRGFFEGAVFGLPHHAGADHSFLVAFDCALLFGMGIWAGCVVFHLLALLFQGGAGGLAVHLQVAAAAGTMAILAPIIMRNRWSATVIGAGLTVAILALDGGYRYPDLILSKANRIWQNQARCLMLGADLRAPNARTDLMALTLPKNEIDPSAVVLLVQDGASRRAFRWSFRARAFTTLPRDAKDPDFCKPNLTILTVD